MAPSKFAKRHYKFIAETVKGSMNTAKFIFQNSEYEIAVVAIRTVLEDLSVRLHYDNPKFDEEKFMIACGIKKGEAK